MSTGVMGHGCSKLVEPHGHASHYSSDGAASDCSTADAHHNDDSISDCYSEAGVKTLMIFDWDDTLFPTSWMQQHNLLEKGWTPTSTQKALLYRLAERARLTLQTAAQVAKVVVVTNGEQGWVEMTCTKFMPSLVSLLKTMEIVSARSTFEQSSERPSDWKRLAFENEVELFYGSAGAVQQNIVSVGDSLHELLALQSVTKDVPNCCGKSIKLVEVPTIEQLIEEHEVLLDCLLGIVEHNGDLDVEVGSEISKSE